MKTHTDGGEPESEKAERKSLHFESGGEERTARPNHSWAFFTESDTDPESTFPWLSAADAWHTKPSLSCGESCPTTLIPISATALRFQCS